MYNTIKPKKYFMTSPTFGAVASVSKGYTYIGGNDFETNTGVTTVNFPVTMTGTAGRLIFITFSPNTTISSVVYDTAGANVSLTQDFTGSTSGSTAYAHSGNIPSASGSKLVTVTYAGSVAFFYQSGIAWLATGLSSGFSNATNLTSPTVVSGNFVFGVQFNSAGGMTDGWVTNSNETPTGHRLSSTSLSGGTQNSASADWATPTTGLSAFSSAGAPLIMAVYN